MNVGNDITVDVLMWCYYIYNFKNCLSKLLKIKKIQIVIKKINDIYNTNILNDSNIKEH